MTIDASESPVDFMEIPPEPWGRKLKRARWDLHRMTLEDATRRVSRYVLTSDAAISRLEASEVGPWGPRQARNRQLAYVLCRVYNVDPAEFGLSPDDLPPNVQPREGSGPSTKWYSGVLVAAA